MGSIEEEYFMQKSLNNRHLYSIMPRLFSKHYATYSECLNRYKNNPILANINTLNRVLNVKIFYRKVAQGYYKSNGSSTSTEITLQDS